MGLYGKIQIIPSIEPSYGKFSNKLGGGGLYRKWIQMFEKSLHTIKKPSTYGI